MIGQHLSDTLIQIEEILWEFELTFQEKPNYTKDGFRAAVKVFSSALLDKIWELQEQENIAQEDRVSMAIKAGDDIRRLIKTYTNIDSQTLYNE